MAREDVGEGGGRVEPHTRRGVRHGHREESVEVSGIPRGAEVAARGRARGDVGRGERRDGIGGLGHERR
jgi:hypothetical protein